LSVFSADFETIFQEKIFDVCINASGSGNVSFSVVHPLSDFEANSYSVALILHTIQKMQPLCKFVHISSAAVYGNPQKLPVNETDDLLPISPYGFHKLISELLCKEYFQLYSLQIAVIRPFSVYGPGLRKQLLWDMLQKCKLSDVISLYGTGNESRDFIHISDLCELIFTVVQNADFRCNFFNAASGVETCISEIAELFISNLPKGKEIIFSGEEKKGDPLNWRADINNVKSIGFSPRIELAEGIKNYITYHSEK
jgi:dTDP-glucose 4,6-dehydratase/UDP-glucose 4-epimerase